MKIYNIPNYNHLQYQASWEKYQEGLILYLLSYFVSLKAPSPSRDTEGAIIVTWKLQFWYKVFCLSCQQQQKWLFLQLAMRRHDPCRSILITVWTSGSLSQSLCDSPALARAGCWSQKTWISIRVFPIYNDDSPEVSPRTGCICGQVPVVIKKSISSWVSYFMLRSWVIFLVMKHLKENPTSNCTTSWPHWTALNHTDKNPITQKSASLLARLIKKKIFHQSSNVEVQLHWDHYSSPLPSIQELLYSKKSRFVDTYMSKSHLRSTFSATLTESRFSPA